MGDGIKWVNIKVLTPATAASFPTSSVIVCLVFFSAEITFSATGLSGTLLMTARIFAL